MIRVYCSSKGYGTPKIDWDDGGLTFTLPGCQPYSIAQSVLENNSRAGRKPLEKLIQNSIDVAKGLKKPE
jgi:hypothetical protein